MPLYRFKGIDVFGTIHRGKLGAPTEKHLSDVLLSEGIIVLTVKPTYHLYFRFISSAEKITFYRNLAQLLHAGVLLPDALEYIAMNSKNIFFQDSVYDLSEKVSSGQSFSQSLISVPALTTPTINFIVNAGQQAGHLEKTCDAIANYLERTKNFRKNLLSVMFMPMMTIVALLALVCVVSHVMLPRLLSMMDLFKNKKNQFQDKIIFKILRTINMQFFLYVLGFIAVICVVCFFVNKIRRGRVILHRLLLCTPLVKTVLIQATLGRIFFMLSLLLKNGVPLTHALSIINQMTVLDPIKVKLSALTDSVKNGMMLSAALSRFFGSYDTYASLMIRVAEKSGTVAIACEQIAKEYDNRMKRMIEHMIMIIQPATIIFLGLLISFLMISLYAPLVEFSMTI